MGEQRQELVNIPIWRKIDRDILLKLRAFVALSTPLIIGGAMEYTVDKVDVPVFEVEGFAPDDSLGADTAIYLTSDHQLDSDGNATAEKASNEYMLPFADQRVVLIEDDNNPEKIAETIVSMTREIESESTKSLLIDADIIHPSTLEIDYIYGDGFINDAKGGSDTLVSSYTLSSHSDGELSDSELVDAVREEISKITSEEGGIESLIFPKSGYDVTLPYRLDEYTAAYEVARQNGFSSVEELYYEIYNQPDSALATQLKSAVLGATDHFNGPAIVFTSLYEESSNIDGNEGVSTESVCAIQVTPVQKEYQLVKPSERTNSLRLLPIGLAIWGLASFGLSSRRRKIAGIEVPDTQTLERLESGEANTLDKLHIFQYRKALASNPAEQVTGSLIKRKQVSLLAGLTFIAGGMIYAVPTINNLNENNKLQAETEQLIDEGTIATDSCSNDDLVVLDSDDREVVDRKVVTTIEDLPPRLVTVFQQASSLDGK